MQLMSTRKNSNRPFLSKSTANQIHKKKEGHQDSLHRNFSKVKKEIKKSNYG